MIGILDWQDGISNWDDKWMWQVESVFLSPLIYQAYGSGLFKKE